MNAPLNVDYRRLALGSDFAEYADDDWGELDPDMYYLGTPEIVDMERGLVGGHIEPLGGGTRLSILMPVYVWTGMTRIDRAQPHVL